MKLPGPSYVNDTFYGVADLNSAIEARGALIDQIRVKSGIFAADNLMTWDKTLGFIREEAFATAVNAHTRPGPERAAVWRYNTLVWAARQAAPLEGDFVECACYRGNTARIVADLVDISNRRYFLYDLFDHDETMPHHAMPAHSKTLYDEVRARFPEPNVIITQGRVPESLAIASPEKIALMHIDMNNVDAEIGALEVLWDRVAPGGVVVLDDYGWLAYHRQHFAERDWFKARGQFVLELPTGQGLVVKHG
ncbi:TylF/MycF/NovP-related O-methyltransferase [Phenylobacterium sp.]|uniref:TylF/MycF/NovP-related O-methyltransferase n=1 Tax=Phenylobacterium sp. TaxID=1871053 RepID=UPI00289A462D|nr:TylF/MycF/NovP-related O-methyltransferase [Phenylobacterium sp.]